MFTYNTINKKVIYKHIKELDNKYTDLVQYNNNTLLLTKQNYTALHNIFTKSIKILNILNHNPLIYIY